MKISPKKAAHLVVFVFFLSTFALFVSYFPNDNILLAQDSSKPSPPLGTCSATYVSNPNKTFTEKNWTRAKCQWVIDALTPSPGNIVTWDDGTGPIRLFKKGTAPLGTCAVTLTSGRIVSSEKNKTLAQCQGTVDKLIIISGESAAVTWDDGTGPITLIKKGTVPLTGGTMSSPTEGTMSSPTEGTMSKPTEGTMSGPTGNSGEIKLTNPFSKGDNLYQFIQAVVSDILLPIGGVVAVIAIIYSGFKLVTARGNETKLEEAKRAFLYTTIGVAILLGAWTIAKVIEKTITQITN